MRSIAPSIAPHRWLAAVMAAAALAWAPTALAVECEGTQRSFAGELQSVKGKQIVVDNKKGDKIKFEQHASSTVVGTKTKWEELKKGDWVAVCSKMLEKPRFAYKVEVQPPKPEEGE
jgi:hypothetical protein